MTNSLFFKDISFYKHKSIRILSLNIRSYNRNFDLLEVMLYRYNLLDNLDLIMLNECWLSKNVIIKQLKNFTPMPIDSKTNKSSGLIVYVKNSLNPSFEDISIKNIYDMVKINIKLFKLEINILFLYRFNNGDKIFFLKSLKNIIKNAKSQNLIILGDFNIDIHKFSDSNKLKYIMTKHGFTFNLPNNSVTRYESQSCIDHVWLNFNNNMNNSFVINPPISDHNSILTLVEYDKVLLNYVISLFFENFDFKYNL